MKKLKFLSLLFIFISPIGVMADDSSVLDLGNFEIEGELRRPTINNINADRQFDGLVDDTILVNYNQLEDKLTQFSLPNEKILIEDEFGNITEEEL